MKQQFLKGKTDTIRLTIYDNNRAVVPTSAKITLYKAGSDEELQAQATATVGATSGEMTYALTTTHTANLGLNYKAVWAYVVSTITYYRTQLFDVVRSKLAISITDEDLFNELELLRDQNYQASGTATAGASGSITDTKRREADNFLKGGTVEIKAGTGVGQKRDITGSTQSSGAIAVTPNWTTTPDTTSVYVLVKSYTKKIQAAFDAICDMLYNKGKRHELILESSQISRPNIYLAIHLICLDLITEQNDKWDKLQAIYQAKFNDAFNSMALEYDEDESGSITDEEKQAHPNEIRIGRA